MRRIASLLLITFAISPLVGCSLMPHALQPEQLWKLNRQPPPSGDAYFSIPADDLPPLAMPEN